MLRSRAAVTAAGVVLAMLAAAGCSGGSGSGGGHGDDGTRTDNAVSTIPVKGPLLGELAHIRSTSASRGWTSYGDLAAQRALAQGDSSRGSALLTGYGWTTTYQTGAVVARKLGFDGSKADRAVEVGETHGAGRFDGGTDPARVGKAAAKLGGKKDGTAGPLTVWRLAADRQMTEQLAGISRHPDYDVLATGGDSLVRASDAKGVEMLTAGAKDRTLASEPRFAAVAQCLGKPLAASATDLHLASGAASSKAAGFVTGAGVTGGDAAHLTQEACRTTGSKEEAERVAGTVRDRLAHGRTKLSKLKWSQLLPGAEVQVAGGPGHVVRLHASTAKNPRIVLDMLLAGDLSDLLDTE